MTSSSARWVLVEGTTGEGATIDRGSLSTVATFDAVALISALFDKAGGRRIHAIGLTWTPGAEAIASAVWQALSDRAVENIIAVSDLEAAEALACGISHIAGYERVAVCVVEPGAAVVTAVTPDGVTAERLGAVTPGDVEALSADAVFVLGSGDVDGVVATLKESGSSPVISADEADLALAKGSALASAAAVAVLDAQPAAENSHLSPTTKLATVLAAAVVTFVVSLSVALGMTLVPDDEPARVARSEILLPEPSPDTPKSATPATAEAAPRPPKSPSTTEAPASAEPVAVAVPVPDAALIVERPAAGLPPLPEYLEPQVPERAYIPPAPAYIPPAPPPNYLPPAPAPGYVAPGRPPLAPVPPAGELPTASAMQEDEPRLRDRIIERIPIINRFHEPDPYN
ncbi:MAG: hypothetical protein AB7G47_00180 [Mycolicibacterium sp.]